MYNSIYIYLHLCVLKADCFQISLQNKDRLLSKLGEYSHQAVASDVQECSTLGK